jgi:hypothetical protein
VSRAESVSFYLADVQRSRGSAFEERAMNSGKDHESPPRTTKIGIPMPEFILALCVNQFSSTKSLSLRVANFKNASKAQWTNSADSTPVLMH